MNIFQKVDILQKVAAGDTVSVTLNNGAKIIDSPVTERRGSLFVVGSFRLCDVGGVHVHPDIWSIDSHTPATLLWDADPTVYAVKDRQGDVWRREEGGWIVAGGTARGSASAGWVHNAYGPCTVYARVVAE